KAPGLDWSGLGGPAAPAAATNSGSAARRPLTSLRVADAVRLMALLEAQGKVTSIANPRVLTLNNEPALVRTDAITLSVTPQIGDAHVTLSVTPVVKAPAVAESDMLARLNDGETLVISGFTRN